MSHIARSGGNKQLSQAVTAQGYRNARPKIPQVGLHTSESPAGARLLSLWQYLDVRTSHGSYNAGADAHGTSNQYAPWSWYTWHAPAINPWAAGISGHCRADEWDTMPRAWRNNIINGMALQAHRYSRWCVSQGLGPVPARVVTGEQGKRGVYGFVYHGSLQADRTDPGGPRNRFPRDQFLAEFRRLESGATAPVAARPAPSTPAPKPEPVKEGIVMSAEDVWRYTGRDFLNEKPQFKDTQLARTYQYAQQTRAEVRELKAMVKALAAAQDKGTGKILEAVEKAERDVIKANAKDVAAELQITTKEA